MARILIVMLILAAPSGGLDGDHRPQQPAGTHGQPRPDSIDPYLIEWYVDINDHADLEPIWRMLGVRAPAESPGRCDGGCVAETFDVEGEPGGASVVGLEISFGGSGVRRYLFFNLARSSPPGARRWAFIGHLDSRARRDRPRSHRIERGEGRVWFIVEEEWSREAGRSAAGEAWHEIRETGLRRVLSYPVEGRADNCSGLPGRSYKSFIVRHGVEKGVYTIPVQFVVSYLLSDCAGSGEARPLFSKGHLAYYVWSDAADRFVIDEARSEIDEAQVEALRDPAGPSRDEFVRLNYVELLEVASEGDHRQREWLKEFVIELEAGPRKRALEKALDRTG